MDILYAPWREAYFTEDKSECVFCSIVKNKHLDEQNKVIYRNENLFIVMNKFPYTPGHILVIPNIHIDSPEKLPKDIWLELFSKAQDSMQILYDYGASGINLGMNIKQNAGAGIPEHLHLHLLPRWSGDTNFITAISNTRSYGIDFNKVFERMKDLANKYLN
ncbi:HIT domain-containing protein [Helicobacter sp. MIT 14-3879]|uniref:HIT family protein n=1 Tax=Helicobacter sp. MIT 14-3879 TaxID=2040649 RepID=UPI000E1E8BBE|nr:HIT domain-containing protein [Helicobacter sp. MIT 14-3879]RDU65470.1 HIT family hydrolase [Helicobacter sp. MIT 14-3879]